LLLFFISLSERREKDSFSVSSLVRLGSTGIPRSHDCSNRRKLLENKSQTFKESTALVGQIVGFAEFLHQVTDPLQVVAWESRKEVVFDLIIQTARKPVHQK